MDWNDFGCGDGLETLINPKDQNLVYYCSQYGSCSRSTNGGESGTNFQRATTSDRHNWKTPLEFDPNDPSITYYGGGHQGRRRHLDEDQQGPAGPLGHPAPGRPEERRRRVRDALRLPGRQRRGARVQDRERGCQLEEHRRLAAQRAGHDVVLSGDALYVASDAGVFRGSVKGARWVPLPGLPDTPVMELRVHTPEKRLYAATFGRGMCSTATPVG
ncbi:MAG: hypothetical protein GEV11_11820 [Streptosporangiales bacterium]|nr:hypothetical protein [Streptosporangiales bacterium]